MVGVVVLSSSRQEQEIVGWYGLGVDRYAVKQVEFDRFPDSAEMPGLHRLLQKQPGF